MVERFNMGALRELIRLRGYTLQRFAAEIGMNAAVLGQKLSGRYEFKAREIRKICDVLGIPAERIGYYFFTPASIEFQTLLEEAN